MTAVDVASFIYRLSAGSAASALTWSAAAAVGWRVATVCCAKMRAVERFAVGLALGYACVGTIVGALGLFHVAYGALAGAVPALLLAFNYRTVFAAARSSRRAIDGVRDHIRSSDWGARVAMGACVAAALTGLVAGALPAIWWDPLAYHLPIAAAALAHHTFAFDPAMTQSGFPLLGEAAALPAFALAGSAGAALVTLGAGCSLALLCGVFAEKLARGAGWLAAALVMTCPLWLWLAPSFYVDVPFALFSIASIGIALDAVANPATLETGGVFMAGALAGAAAAVKYPGLEIALVSACLVALARRSDAIVKSFAVYTGAAVAVAGGWYLRTAMLTHDPVYPFLTAHVGANESLRAFADRYVGMTLDWCGGSGSFADALALPWRMLSGDSAQAYCGDVGYALRLGVVFFIVAVVLVPRTWPTAVAAFALTLAWFEGSRQDRFVLPALCLYAMTAAVGAAAAPTRLRRTGAIVLVAVGLVAVAAEWTPSLIGIASNSIAPAFAYVAGTQGGDEYLTRRLEFFSADEWMHAHLPPGVGIAALDDVRDYYEPAVWINPYYQPAVSVDWTQPPSSRYRALTALGIKYVVVNANKYYVDRTPTGVDWQALGDDVRTGWLRAVYSANDVTVFRIGSGR